LFDKVKTQMEILSVCKNIKNLYSVLEVDKCV